jgi:hypothetical protein
MPKTVIAYLDELIKNAPEEQKGAVPAQVITAGGRMYAGSVRRHPDIEGLIVIITAGERQGGNGRKEVVMAQIALDEGDIREIHHQVAVDEGPRIFVPQGAGQVLPATAGPRVG